MRPPCEYVPLQLFLADQFEKSEVEDPCVTNMNQIIISKHKESSGCTTQQIIANYFSKILKLETKKCIYIQNTFVLQHKSVAVIQSFSYCFFIALFLSFFSCYPVISTFSGLRTSKTAVGFQRIGTLSVSHCTVRITNYKRTFIYEIKLTLFCFSKIEETP